MNCTKCQGLMVEESLNDGFVRMNGWRCVNCGALFDSVIGDNQGRHRRKRIPSDASQFISSTEPTLSGVVHSVGTDGGEFRKAVSVARIVGPCCSTPADGQRVNTLIQSLLNEGNSVELDFHGVKLVTSSFYRAAVGDLTSVFPEDFVQSHLSVCGLSEGMTEGLEFLTAGIPKPN
jgi:hypothetical protein